MKSPQTLAPPAWRRLMPRRDQWLRALNDDTLRADCRVWIRVLEQLDELVAARTSPTTFTRSHLHTFTRPRAAARRVGPSTPPFRMRCVSASSVSPRYPRCSRWLSLDLRNLRNLMITLFYSRPVPRPHLSAPKPVPARRGVSACEHKLVRSSPVCRCCLPSDRICEAEIHWYEAHGVGRREFKLKRIIDFA